MPYGATPPGLASQILNLAEILLRRPILRVPRYQRPYAWTEREVRQLIQDLWRAYARQATFYFVGQIVLVRKGRDELEISDGQQRLATLTMIIAYVRDRLPNRASHFHHLVMLNEDGGRPRIMLRASDAGFYRAHVQEPNRIRDLARMQETGVDSQDLMCNAAATIEGELGGVSDRELENFMSYVVRCTTFNVVECDERGAAAGIYNAMNITGLDLSAADNIKCDLLENSGLSEGDAGAAALKWEELETDLGRQDFATLINKMPFLLTGAPLISPGDLGAFRAQVEKTGGVRGFLFDRLPRYGESLKEILAGDVKIGAASAEVNRRIQIMLQLGEWRWYHAALVFLSEHRDQTHQAVKFFRALERFTFGCELAVIDNTVREDRFSLAMKQAGSESVYEEGGPLDLSEQERIAFMERLDRSMKGDRWRRMLLIRIEAALPGGAVISHRADTTAEHVLPAGAAPKWEAQFSDPKRRAEAANLLGNLVLVTRKQNQRASNKSYAEKRDIYFKTPGAPIYAITRMIEHIEHWTYEAIETRHEQILSLLGADWDIVPEK